MKSIVTLFTLILAGSSIWAAAGPPTAGFELEQVRFDATSEIFSYDGLKSTIAVGRMRLPLKTAYIELLPDETINSISFETSGHPYGSLKASADQLADSPTSEDYRYQNIKSSAATEKLGFQPISVGEVVTIDSRRFAHLEICPVYLSEDSTFTLTDQISIRVGDRPVAASELLSEESVSAATISNKNSSPSAAGFSTVQLVMITSESLAQYLEPLRAHRIATGLSSEIVTIDQITSSYAGVDDAERLREYLKDFYADGGQFVLLVGDETVLPVRYAYPYNVDILPRLEELQVCDLYFADISSNWDVDNDQIFGERDIDLAHLNPELSVGRLPFNSPYEIVNYVEKLIIYETDPGKGEPEYLKKAFFFSADQMRDYAGIGQHAIIAQSYPSSFFIDTTLGVEASSGFDQNPFNATAADLVDNLFEGYGFINVINHGRVDGFAVRTSGLNNWPKSYLISDATGTGNASFDQLPENFRTSFYYSLACDQAGYDLDQPPASLEGRNMVQQLLGQSKSGAVGFVGYSRWGWVSSSHLLHKAFFDSLFAHPDRPAIEAMYASQAEYYPYRDLIYGQNFHGDPSLVVYTDIPGTINISLVAESGALEITAQSGGVKLSDCKIVISQKDEILAEGFTGADGTVVLAVTFDSTADYSLAAVKNNYITDIKRYNVGLATDVDDDNSNLPATFQLGQNYPNPFNPTTVIPFALPTRSNVRLQIFNLLGQEVNVLTDQIYSAGTYELEWNGSDRIGQQLATGIYFYRLETDSFVDIKKMVLLK